MTSSISCVRRPQMDASGCSSFTESWLIAARRRSVVGGTASNGPTGCPADAKDLVRSWDYQSRASHDVLDITELRGAVCGTEQHETELPGRSRENS